MHLGAPPLVRTSPRPTSGPKMLMICGDEEPYGIDCGKQNGRTMARAQQRSSGCGGRELVSQHGCKVPCSHPGPALAQRPDRQRGTTDATVKGAASRGKSPGC
ncbi:hypothetical protein GGI35DRAFT_149962 [Trichoderma velutinum]